MSGALGPHRRVPVTSIASLSIASAEAAATDTFVEIRHESDGRRLAWRPQALAASAAEAEALQLDPDGVYWITGGLGGLGSHLREGPSSHAARAASFSAVAAKRWTRHLAARSIEELRAHGADVRYIPCDVASRDRRTETCRRQSEARLGH